jgi:hypothetical protein
MLLELRRWVVPPGHQVQLKDGTAPLALPLQIAYDTVLVNLTRMSPQSRRRIHGNTW